MSNTAAQRNSDRLAVRSMATAEAPDARPDRPRYPGEPRSLTRRIDEDAARTDFRSMHVGVAPDSPGSAQLWRSDYLALMGHPAIVQAQIDVLRGAGDDLYMSAAFLSDKSSQRALEQQMARFLGAEDAVLCQSGWCANVGLIQTVAGGRDFPIYIDALTHASVWDGANGVRAPTHQFIHNDPENLDQLVRQHGPGLVVVEAIYAADGTICPLGDIVAVSEQHGCQLMVDESHSLGVHGRNGQGLVSLLELSDKVTYRTYSLTNALAARAGMVTGPTRVTEFFRFESRPAIFSSAVLPHEVAGVRAALEVIQEEDWRRRLLKRNVSHLRTSLAESGHPVEPDGSQIIALPPGPGTDAVALCQALAGRRVFAAPPRHDQVADGQTPLRLLVSCALTDQQLVDVVEACRWAVKLGSGGSARSSGLRSVAAPDESI